MLLANSSRAGHTGGVSEQRRHAQVSGLVSSVQRALQALEVVAQLGDGTTAKAVARRLGYKLPTTYHLLGTLVTEGYLVHLDEGGYGLGYKVADLHDRLRGQLQVSETVAAILHDVHEGSEAAAYYTVFRDGDVVVAHIDDCVRHPRAKPLDIGYHESAHATAYGKVMLATLPEKMLASRVGARGLPRLTARTLTTISDLARELERVRSSGVATEVEEMQRGMACVAAPVRDHRDQVCGAVAVSSTPDDFAQRRRRLERWVRTGADRAARTLAGTG